MKKAANRYINGYRLVNSLEEAEQYLPSESRALAAQISIGTRVNVTLRSDLGAESFWLQVVKRLPRNRYRGRVSNYLFEQHGVQADDEIEFGIQHVIDYHQPE